MRCWVSAAACLGLVLLSSPTRGAERPGRVEASLTLRPLAGIDEIVAFATAGIGMSVSGMGNGPALTDVGDYVLPALAGQPRLLDLGFPRNGPILPVLAESAPAPGGYTRLWIDWNGDRRFAREEEAKLKGCHQGRERHSVFGPITGRLPYGDKPAAVYCVLNGDGYGRLVPGAYREGRVRLGGRAVKVGLVDADLSGCLDDLALDYGGNDLLLVDVDGNGRFALDDRDNPSHAWQQERLTLARVVQMPDGRFYRTVVAENGSRIAFEPSRLPLGRVNVDADRFVLTLFGEEGDLLVCGTGSEAAVPAGRYVIQDATLGIRDASGGVWVTTSSFDAPQPRLRVRAGSTTGVAYGPPYRLVLQLEPRHGIAQLCLRILDIRGNWVHDIRTPAGRHPSPAGITITDSTGRVVLLGLLDPESDGFPGVFRWSPPPDISGTVKASVNWPLGPLKAKPAECSFSVDAIREPMAGPPGMRPR